MRLQYYPDTDSAYIEVSRSPGVETVEVADGVNIDLGEHGELVGIELEHASKHLDSSMLSKIEKEGSLLGLR